jgi:hypothetical protein
VIVVAVMVEQAPMAGMLRWQVINKRAKLRTYFVAIRFPNCCNQAITVTAPVLRIHQETQSSFWPVVSVISHATTAKTPGNAVITSEKSTTAL